jgi:hypothetical protein
LILLAAAAGWAVGTWRCATPEPNRLDTTADLNVRRSIRVCAGLLLLSIPITLVCRKSGSLFLAIFLAQLFCLTLGSVALLIRLRGIALRIPNAKEARAAKRLVPWFFVCFASTALGGVSGIMGIRLLGVMIFVATSLDMVLIILYTLLLDRTWRTLDGIAEQVRQREATTIPLAGSQQQE